MNTSNDDQQYEQSDTNNEEEGQNNALEKAEPQGQRTMQRARQNRQRNQPLPAQADAANAQMVAPRNQQMTGTVWEVTLAPSDNHE
jgi:hypothetical protein